MAIEWTTDLATGLYEIDREHEELHTQLEQLVEQVDEANALNGARAVAAVLKKHVITHFADEYDTMRAYGYPAIDEHHAEHEEILEYVRAFEDEMLTEAIEPQLLVAATRVLSNWILTHTNTFDRDFARFVRSLS